MNNKYLNFAIICGLLLVAIYAVYWTKKRFAPAFSPDPIPLPKDNVASGSKVDKLNDLLNNNLNN